MKGVDVTDFMYETRVLEVTSVLISFQIKWTDLLSHLEETESKAEITLNLDGKIWENKEPAI